MHLAPSVPACSDGAVGALSTHPVLATSAALPSFHSKGRSRLWWLLCPTDTDGTHACASVTSQECQQVPTCGIFNTKGLLLVIPATPSPHPPTPASVSKWCQNNCARMSFYSKSTTLRGQGQFSPPILLITLHFEPL